MVTTLRLSSLLVGALLVVSACGAAGSAKSPTTSAEVVSTQDSTSPNAPQPGSLTISAESTDGWTWEGAVESVTDSGGFEVDISSSPPGYARLNVSLGHTNCPSGTWDGFNKVCISELNTTNVGRPNGPILQVGAVGMFLPLSPNGQWSDSVNFPVYCFFPNLTPQTSDQEPNTVDMVAVELKAKYPLGTRFLACEFPPKWFYTDGPNNEFAVGASGDTLAPSYVDSDEAAVRAVQADLIGAPVVWFGVPTYNDSTCAFGAASLDGKTSVTVDGACNLKAVKLSAG